VNIEGRLRAALSSFLKCLRTSGVSQRTPATGSKSLDDCNTANVVLGMAGWYLDAITA
jgi:hypothetical protein